MIDGVPRLLTLVGAIGSGLVAGVFFAFSTFVMKGLSRVPAPTGIAAMQAINVAAPTPLFMVALFGTAAVGVASAVSAVVRWGEAAVYDLAGGAVYLVVVVLTGVYHVPRNNALASVDPQAPGAAETWTRYLSEWTAWNHVRTLAALAAAVLFTLSLRAGA